MAEAGRLTAPTSPPVLGPVAKWRTAIIVTVLVAWEALAASGLLYRDVVPSWIAIGRALIGILSDPSFYWHLGVTAGEIGAALAIGGSLGLLVGLVISLLTGRDPRQLLQLLQGVQERTAPAPAPAGPGAPPTDQLGTFAAKVLRSSGGARGSNAHAAAKMRTGRKRFMAEWNGAISPMHGETAMRFPRASARMARIFERGWSCYLSDSTALITSAACVSVVVLSVMFQTILPPFTKGAMRSMTLIPVSKISVFGSRATKSGRLR